MKFAEEFKAFALRGNVFDLAIGVLIGGAFSGLVTSLTQNIISPFLGIFGGLNFNQFKFAINGADIMYGAFITDIINFLIMALVIFTLMKALRRLETVGAKAETKAEPSPTTKTCPFCKEDINKEATRCSHCGSQVDSI